jgi:CIC family chloride channel protein
LTAIASVAEMTGNFTLTLPIMLACGLAAQLARQITKGSVYTTKLLRRGIDIERPKAIDALRALHVEQVMQQIGALDGQPLRFTDDDGSPTGRLDGEAWSRLVGPVTLRRRPQMLFGDEDLEQARRQLVVYGRDGLPVLSHDGKLRGWLTRSDVLAALADRLDSSEQEIERGATVAERAAGTEDIGHRPTRPLPGHELLELRVHDDSPALGRRLIDIDWPPGTTVVAVTEGREVRAARPDFALRAGERVLVLAPVGAAPRRGDSARGVVDITS